MGSAFTTDDTLGFSRLLVNARRFTRRFLPRAIDCERIEPEQDEKFIRDELTRPEQGGEIRHAVQNAYDYQYGKKGVRMTILGPEFISGDAIP